MTQQLSQPLHELIDLVYHDLDGAMQIKDREVVTSKDEHILLQMVLLINLIEEYHPWVLGGRKPRSARFPPR